MKFLFSDCIIIRYNHNHITKFIVTFPRRGGGGGEAVAPACLTLKSYLLL